VSTGGANVGELRLLDNSVGGVDVREWWELDDTLGDCCAWTDCGCEIVKVALWAAEMLVQ
jgi:hypothetical protein